MKRETAKRGDSILSYGLLVMIVTHTLTHVFGRVYTALFPILRDEFSLSIQQLGIIAAIPPLCQTILAIPSGLLSDRLGSKKMLLASLVIAAIGSLAASQAANPLMFIIAASLVYVNTTIYHPAAYSFITRFSRPRDRSKALGLHGAGGTLGMAIGPISISILVGALALGWRQVYLFWSFPILLGIITVLRIKSEPKEVVTVDTVDKGNVPQTSSLLSPSLALFLLFLGLRMVAHGMSGSFMALYLVDDRNLSESLASFFIGTNSLMGIVAAPIGGFFAARYGDKRWLLRVLALSYTCFGLAFMISNTTVFVILYLIYGFFNLLGMAANSAIMAQLSPSKQRGLGYALFFLPGSLVGAIAPIVAASIAETFGLSSLFYVSIAVYFAGLGVLRFGVKV